MDGIRRLKKKIADDKVFYGGDLVQVPRQQQENAAKTKKVNQLFTPGARETAAHMSQELNIREKVSGQPTAEESAVL